MRIEASGRRFGEAHAGSFHHSYTLGGRGKVKGDDDIYNLPRSAFSPSPNLVFLCQYICTSTSALPTP